MAERRGSWQIVSREPRYDNPWIRVTHHDVITPTGTPGIYGTVHFKNVGIGILPVDREHHTGLVGQSAARELAEETGLRAGRWQKIVDCDLSNSVTDERIVGYLAWDLEQGTAEPDPTEVLAVRRVPLEEAFRRVDSGEIRDALSVLTLRAAQLLLLQGRFPVPRDGG